jgi:DNA-binding transcriptional MocR family regulator
MFVWLTFRVDRTPFELFQLFAAAGVITVPGNDFQVPGVGENIDTSKAAERTGTAAVRLTFAASSPEQIRKAVKAMADCLMTI